ncbi:MAG: hypothetical protein V2I51_18665, partial [Anderseniella sp.]|nr:hypothetical protein [Anderseniella sp.]
MFSRGGVIGAAGFAAGGGGSDPEFGALGSITALGGTGSNQQTSVLTNVAAGDLVLAFVQRNLQNDSTTVSMAGTAMTLLRANAS